MTVGELVKLLQQFDQNLPVLVDGYEWGFQLAKSPRQTTAVRRDGETPICGDWESPDGIGWDTIVEPEQPVVVIER